jgi:hypothetical protein
MTLQHSEKLENGEMCIKMMQDMVDKAENDAIK